MLSLSSCNSGTIWIPTYSGPFPGSWSHRFQPSSFLLLFRLSTSLLLLCRQCAGVLLWYACGLSVSLEGSGARTFVRWCWASGTSEKQSTVGCGYITVDLTFGRSYTVPTGPQLRPVKVNCLKVYAFFKGTSMKPDARILSVSLAVWSLLCMLLTSWHHPLCGSHHQRPNWWSQPASGSATVN